MNNGFNGHIYEKSINPRLAVELTILHFNPEISSEDLLNLREQIILEAFHKEGNNGYPGMYNRDYYLYTRKCYV